MPKGKIKSIMMSADDREYWQEHLEKYYRDQGFSEEKVKKKIQKVFSECQRGWTNAPIDLGTRIKMKTGFQWKSHDNLMPKQVQKEKEEIVDEDGLTLFDMLNDKERNWWNERVKEYEEDFEFNRSSDKPLLEQLLVEEVLQRRLFKSQLRNRGRDYGRALSDSMKRVAELQTKLGITREQRAGIMDKIDGNVAQIASDLDEKYEHMEDTLRKEFDDEIKYLNRHRQRDPVNMVPPAEKIAAILGGEKDTFSIDDDKAAMLTEEAVKKTKERRELDNLPDGVEI